RMEGLAGAEGSRRGVGLAARLVQAGEFSRAAEALDAAPAALRGFEWHLLRKACRRQLAVLKRPGAVTAAAFAPGGGSLAVADDSGSITLWDPQTRQILRALPGAVGTAVAFSPDGRRLAAGGHDRRAPVRD